MICVVIFLTCLTFSYYLLVVFFGSSIWIFYISWYSLLCLHQHIFFRHGNCILFDRQSLQYHSDRQQWAAVPEHTGAWNWKSHNDGKKEKERKKESCMSPHITSLSFQLLVVCCFCRCCQRKTWDSTWTIMWRRSEVWMAR